MTLCLSFLITLSFATVVKAKTIDYKTEDEIINVKLTSLGSIGEIKLNKEYYLSNNKEFENRKKVKAGSYKITKTNKGISLGNEMSSNELFLFPVNYDLNSTIEIDKKNYLGLIKINKNSISNELPLEHYLYGVVPYEIGTGSYSGHEAKAAQAIISRTYALKGKNLTNTVSSQVYKGYNPKHEDTKRAVDETKGKVLYYNGKIVDVNFSASNGGYMKTPINIWGSGTNHPYLSYKKDKYDGVDSKNDTAAYKPHSQWKITVKKDLKDNKTDLQNNIKRHLETGAENIKITNIKTDLSNDKTNPNKPLTTTLEIEYKVKGETKKASITDKTYTMYMNRFFGTNTSDVEGNAYPSLRSPNIVSIKNNKNEFVVTGSGYGHGIGMSHAGAIYMSKIGKTHKEIIEHYFPRTNIININKTSENKTKHIVIKGDTLYSIAKNNNLTVEELKKMNNLKTDIISIGQALTLIKNNEEIKPEVEPEDTKLYTVKKGDTLYSISNNFGLTVNELKKINNLKTDLITIGQKLKTESTKDVYVIKKGDTLWGISVKLNTTVKELKSKNGLKTDVIHIGQKLEY